MDNPPLEDRSLTDSTPPAPRRSLRQWLVSGLAVIYKAKVFLVFASLMVSLLVYGLTLGWAFGIGLLAIIVVHESGHVLANRARGISASWPTFIPFLGAVISLKQSPRNADDEAFIGIAGPVFGILASIVSFGLYETTGYLIFAMVALFGMVIHIFNLIPVVPLDGGRTVAFLGWKAWGPGLVGLAIMLFYSPMTNSFQFDPITLIILAFIVWNFSRRIRHGVPPQYNDIPLSHKWFYGSLWAFLMGVSVVGYLFIGSILHLGIS